MERLALITGVAGGIGRTTAQVFSDAGWRVIGLDVATPAALEGVADYHQVDLADADALVAVCAAIRRKYQGLDTLVNLAAHQVCGSVSATSLAEWDKVQAVNVRAPFLLAQAMLPLLLVSRGSIVNVSSVHAVATSSNIAAYATSKGALVALTRALAVELAAQGVRVNAVLPGAVDTPMLRAGLQRAYPEAPDPAAALLRRLPLGRIGQPSEIAQAILFLADNEKSSYMTGQTLTIDGGATARLCTE